MKATTMLAVILTIATIGVLALPPPAQAEEVVLLVNLQIDDFINAPADAKLGFVIGTLDGAGVFLRQVYEAAFHCDRSVLLWSKITAKATTFMLDVPHESWGTTAAAPIVFDAMFALGCTIGRMERKP